MHQDSRTQSASDDQVVLRLAEDSFLSPLWGFFLFYIMEYTLIRSARRTLALQIQPTGELIVRAPRLYPEYLIRGYLEKKSHWIHTHQTRLKEKNQNSSKKLYTAKEIIQAKKELREYIIPRLRELWIWRGLPEYTSIKITSSEKRWWSCSGKNWLCFSYRLAEYLEWKTEFIDAVIVHELAHLREKHHQKSFWELVYQMMPEYERVMKDQKNFD